MKSSQSSKLIWSAGTPNNKEKEILLYGPINSAILELTNELNTYYSKYIRAYYLTTGLMLPSTLGELFIEKLGKPSIKTHSPEVLAKKIINTIKTNPTPGIIKVSHD